VIADCRSPELLHCVWEVVNLVKLNCAVVCCDAVYCGIQQHNRRTDCCFIWDRRVKAMNCMAISRLLEIQFNIILHSIPSSFFSDCLLPLGLINLQYIWNKISLYVLLCVPISTLFDKSNNICTVLHTLLLPILYSVPRPFC
jgi:hypothetical protein